MRWVLYIFVRNLNKLLIRFILYNRLIIKNDRLILIIVYKVCEKVFIILTNI